MSDDQTQGGFDYAPVRVPLGPRSEMEGVTHVTDVGDETIHPDDRAGVSASFLVRQLNKHPDVVDGRLPAFERTYSTEQYAAMRRAMTRPKFGEDRPHLMSRSALLYKLDGQINSSLEYFPIKSTMAPDAEVFYEDEEDRRFGYIYDQIDESRGVTLNRDQDQEEKAALARERYETIENLRNPHVQNLIAQKMLFHRTSDSPFIHLSDVPAQRQRGELDPLVNPFAAYNRNAPEADQVAAMRRYLINQIGAESRADFAELVDNHGGIAEVPATLSNLLRHPEHGVMADRAFVMGTNGEAKAMAAICDHLALLALNAPKEGLSIRACLETIATAQEPVVWGTSAGSPLMDAATRSTILKSEFDVIHDANSSAASLSPVKVMIVGKTAPEREHENMRLVEEELARLAAVRPINVVFYRPHDNQDREIPSIAESLKYAWRDLKDTHLISAPQQVTGSAPVIEGAEENIARFQALTGYDPDVLAEQRAKNPNQILERSFYVQDFYAALESAKPDVVIVTGEYLAAEDLLFTARAAGRATSRVSAPSTRWSTEFLDSAAEQLTSVCTKGTSNPQGGLTRWRAVTRLTDQTTDYSGARDDEDGVGPLSFGKLSDFAPAVINYNERDYKTVAHATAVAFGRLDPDEISSMKAVEARNAMNGAIGQRDMPASTLLFSVLTMRDFQRQKFLGPKSDPENLYALMQTGTMPIENHNNFDGAFNKDGRPGDSFWGKRPLTQGGVYEGDNHLGRILMDVRLEVQNKIVESSSHVVMPASNFEAAKLGARYEYVRTADDATLSYRESKEAEALPIAQYDKPLSPTSKQVMATVSGHGKRLFAISQNEKTSQTAGAVMPVGVQEEVELDRSSPPINAPIAEPARSRTVSPGAVRAALNAADTAPRLAI
jgi:hypothetical protein